MVTGGEWLVSYPAACTLDCHIEFLPDASGGDAAVRAEFEAWIASAAAADPWLRDNPPRMEWLLGAVPPAEIAPSEPGRGDARRRRA
jgi:acetylornithine deacetylase